jgi:uncharacterized membrane protein
MKCPSCRKDNPPGSRFCSTCGNYLMPDTEQTASPADIERGTALQQAEGNKEELRRLRELLARVDKRLETLERMQGEPAPQAPVAPAPQRVPPSTSAQEKPPVTSAPGASRKAAPRKTSEWEMIFGGNWLARIGVLALFIGIAFFIKFAIDKGWLVPAMRVILGVLAGSVMIGGGHFWRKRYPTLSQTLSGGGIAVLYLSIFAAFAFFQMLNIYAAVALLFLISAGSAALAFRYNSLALALIGIAGAYAAPFVLGSGQAGGTGVLTSGSGTGAQLLVYIIVVDLGIIFISTFRNWQWFTLLAFFGSLLTFGGWYNLYGNSASLLLSEGSLTVLFLIFVGCTMLYNLVKKQTPRDFDYLLMVANAAAYFLASYGLMQQDMRGWMGAFTLLLAVFYAALGFAVRSRTKKNHTLGVFAFSIAIALFTIAVLVQFRDSAWVTVIWSLEFVVLTWCAIRLKLSWLMSFSMIAFVLVAGRLLRYDTMVDIRTYQPVINERVLAFIAGISATYLVAYLIRRAKKNAEQWLPFTSVLLVAANLFTLWVLSFEVWNYFGSQLIAGGQINRLALRNMQNLSLTALWAFYAMILLVIGISKRWRLVRIWALGLLIIPIIKVFLYDVWALQTIYRIVAFIGLGILLIAGGYLYQRNSKTIIGFFTDRHA